MRYGMRIVGILCLSWLSACSIIHTGKQMRPVCAHFRWGLAAFNNNTVFPEAGSQAMAITASILPTKGIASLTMYQPRTPGSPILISPAKMISVENALIWARKHQLYYLMVGAVNEWGYLQTLNDKAIVAVSLQLYDVNSGTIIWSSVGNLPGASGTTVSENAQYLIVRMLSTLHVQP